MQTRVSREFYHSGQREDGRTFCNTYSMGFLHERTNTSCTYIARYNYALAFISTRIEAGGRM